MKPWVDKNIHDALRSHTTAYKAGRVSSNMDKAAYNVRSVVAKAKRSYGGKLESQLQQCDSRSQWKGLQTITDYKQTASSVMNANAPLADKLNTFYIRFDAAANNTTNGCMCAERTSKEQCFQRCSGE